MVNFKKHLAHVDTSIRQALELLRSIGIRCYHFLVDDENKLLEFFNRR